MNEHNWTSYMDASFEDDDTISDLCEKCYQKGFKEAVEEISGIVFGGFRNDEMKILTLQQWIKEIKDEYQSEC